MNSEHVTVDDYVEALVSELVARSHRRLELDEVAVSSSLRRVVADLRVKAKAAYADGDEALCHDLLRILDSLSPNPNTGAFDGFLTAFLSLQPGDAGFGNPLYESMHLRGSGARSATRSLPPKWRQIVAASAQHLLKAA